MQPKYINNPSADLTRPETLIEGATYLILENAGTGNPLSIDIVKFLAYTPCPAVVMVIESNGRKMFCPRDRLFHQPGGVML